MAKKAGEATRTDACQEVDAEGADCPPAPRRARLDAGDDVDERAVRSRDGPATAASPTALIMPAELVEMMAREVELTIGKLGSCCCSRRLRASCRCLLTARTASWIREKLKVSQSGAAVWLSGSSSRPFRGLTLSLAVNREEETPMRRRFTSTNV